jgi:uncharacterized membrane protein
MRALTAPNGSDPIRPDFVFGTDNVQLVTSVNNHSVSVSLWRVSQVQIRPLDRDPGDRYCLMMSNQTSPGPIYLDAVLRPNRSLSPIGFYVLMSILSGVSLIVATAFVLKGAWPVFGFFGADVLGVYWAFKLSYRQGREREFVRVTPDQLSIERVDVQGKCRAESFPSFWARVTIDDPPQHESQLTISASGRSAIVGRFLAPEERASFADVLRDALMRAKSSPSTTP